MPPKAKARGQQPQAPQPSDYETDAPSDAPPQPSRSNDELNLRVLRRHSPEVVAIRHVAPYAVLYTCSEDSQQWEKIGIEGTLFLCELTPSATGADRFSIFILNRRGLNNFDLEITSSEEIEISDEYIFVQGDQTYGIWVFSESPSSSTADSRTETVAKIQALAAQATESRNAKEQTMGEAQATEQVPESVPMGRQLSYV